MLTIHAITFGYSEKELLKGVTLSLARGEKGVLLGESGSGKTTLFSLLTELYQPNSGSIEKEGKVTLMMQRDLLLPWRTLLENLLLVEELEKGFVTPEFRQEALQMIGRLGLSGYENAFPQTLSQGMRQRASLARALLQKREILLLDEPLSALDYRRKEEMIELIKEVSKDLTLLFITHDLYEAFALADKLFILEEGKIGRTYLLPKDEDERNHLMQSIRATL